MIPEWNKIMFHLQLFGVTLHAKAAVLINADGFVEVPMF